MRAPARESRPEIKGRGRPTRAYVLADNQLAITGSGWDPELLRLELGELGSGKTRSGAEWVRAQVAACRRRIALVAPTAADEVVDIVHRLPRRAGYRPTSTHPAPNHGHRRRADILDSGPLMHFLSGVVTLARTRAGSRSKDTFDRNVWFVDDSPPEEAGFELSVPPERKAFPRALDRFRRPSVTRRQA